MNLTPGEFVNDYLVDRRLVGVTRAAKATAGASRAKPNDYLRSFTPPDQRLPDDPKDHNIP